ncbi:MAG: phosphoribosylaminoimidazolesuccinocarboxamide synthase [Gemmatimonadota bacterium]
MSQAADRVELPFPLLREGKVREVYELGSDLLFVATDRISAFDCVLPRPIPHKGAVLTQLSAFWFESTGPIVRNHMLATDAGEIVERVPELAATRDRWEGRSMLVRRTDPFPIECVVRGYLAGSAWKEYRENGTLAGEPLPEGLEEACELPEPLFSPATKAEQGHDENISFAEMARRLGAKPAELLREHSLALYHFASQLLRERGILLADTKFEFGTSRHGEILLIDEALTPDSSRLWPLDLYEPGRGQPSLDKQPVRDYLDGLVADGKWNRHPPAPELPDEVVEATSARYLEAFRRVTGRELDP